MDGNVKINSAQRLFLIILLFHANQAGVVDSLSFNRLSKLSGMTRERLKSQLNRLMALGYIENYTAGVACSSIFGRRPGIFFLNISTDCYGKYGRQVQACILPYLCPEGESVLSIAAQVFDAIVDSASVPDHSIQRAVGFGDGKTVLSVPYYHMRNLEFITHTPLDNRVIAYFRHVIYKYAGFWVDRDFGVMNLMSPGAIDDHRCNELMQPIILDIRPASKHVETDDMKRLARLVLYISGQYAKIIKRFCEAKMLDLASKRVLILPSGTVNEERELRFWLIADLDTSD